MAGLAEAFEAMTLETPPQFCSVTANPLFHQPGPPPSIATPLTGTVELHIAGALLQVAAATTNASSAAAVAAAADGAHAGGSIDELMAAVSTAELRAFRAEQHFAAAAPRFDGHGNLLAFSHAMCT